MEHTRYHKFLRAFAVVTALVLVFDSGLISPVTKDLSQNTVEYLAATIGVGASVPPNDINTITAALTQKEQQLNAREAALNARTIPARDFSSSSSPQWSTYILSVILFLLTTLIVVNYILDWNRSRRTRRIQATAETPPAPV